MTRLHCIRSGRIVAFPDEHMAEFIMQSQAGKWEAVDPVVEHTEPVHVENAESTILLDRIEAAREASKPKPVTVTAVDERRARIEAEKQRRARLRNIQRSGT